MVFHVCILLEFCWRIMCRNWWFRFVCCAAKFCFTAKTEPSAVNWYSLPICVLRSEILFRCRKPNLLQGIDIRCRFVCCAAKFCFAAETELPAANWYSLPSCVLCNETVAPTAMQLSLPNWLPAAKQLLLPNWQPTANQFSVPNWASRSEPVITADFYNKSPRQEWLKC